MTTKKKLEPIVIMDEASDPALMEISMRIAASLAMKFGVMRPTPMDASQIADAALTYGRAVVSKVRDGSGQN